MKHYFIYASLLLGALTATTSHAAIIDHGTYLSDLTNNKDWLDVTATIDRSYDDISSKFGVGQEFDGWSYANSSDLEALVISAAGAPDSVNTNTLNYTGEKLDELIALLGVTRADGRAESVLGILIDETSAFNTMGILRDILTPGVDDIAFLRSGAFFDSFANSITGNYLIRDSVSVSAVPIPAAIYLMGSGLIGLLGVRRKKS
ncbi:MAG: VPLPA-CTERM sorting domain-containing protein [Methylophagaceae bacterium]